MLLDLAIVVIKAVIVLTLVLSLASFMTWIERKVSALIQDRHGANRASIFGFDLAGLINTLVADPVKGFVKEDFVPKGVSVFMHALGPFLAVFPVMLVFAVIPFGPSFTALDREITLQLADLNVGILYIFAMGSLGVYGLVLAGWISNNKFALFGGLRATAQMISYEVTMGISLIGLLAIYQTLDLAKIVEMQSGTVLGFLPNWGVVLNPVGFIVFFIAVMAETKRAPFDLPECESELVAGYMTEYSGMKFLLFWLGEFSEIVVAGTLVTVLFFGGWQLPYVDLTQVPSDLWGILPGVMNEWNFQWAPILGITVFGAKVLFFSTLQVIIRWTLPRFRYDQLMHMCWKILLPISLLNLFVTVVVLLLCSSP